MFLLHWKISNFISITSFKNLFSKETSNGSDKSFGKYCSLLSIATTSFMLVSIRKPVKILFPKFPPLSVSNNFGFLFWKGENIFQWTCSLLKNVFFEGTFRPDSKRLWTYTKTFRKPPLLSVHTSSIWKTAVLLETFF